MLQVRSKAWMSIYTSKMKRITIAVLTIAVAALVVSLQPFFLGYLDINTARLMSCPIAFIVLCFLILHFLQNWRLLVSLFKNKKSYRVSRLTVTMLMIVIRITDIASGWVSAVSGEERYLLFPMWVWSWIFTLLVAIHVYQRRKLFLSYWRKLSQRA
jgi:membrane protease YdiL (CAAX protease family)